MNPHDKHKAMLNEHRIQKQASRDRTFHGKHRDYKRESEDFGFKPTCVPSGIHTLVFTRGKR
jgi:hypothetical protein